MDKVLYVAMTGARENMNAQQVRANNLANVTTTGFKQDFEQARSMRVFGDGHASRVYSMAESPGTNRAYGTLQQTGRDLDVAVANGGWLAVQAPDGTEGYTRAGDLQINAANQLVTGSGLPVLGVGGAPIVIPPAEKIEIANDGSINIRPLGDDAVGLAMVDMLKIVELDPATSFKGTSGLLRTNDQQPLMPMANAQVRSGYLESSNVNAVEELTAMITLSRQYEIQVKMMKTAEENSSAAARVLQLS
ncbi:Flagellar basal-body rod protein FlgF [Nitrincola lacisaponensis]|uniref:Flagellar basal-body rod protein FlgF n=1 Tax=Nitrincola lacisaponensis TaxID=267850 RepID=A0A063Y433_9GAMM|nr:flagellar basal-body rod protein FlgF [Nitrincola lacisaponensis]KDE40439.1 Flagellar basal-body rod protein FlgF [Nitrincola lacisaponensis]